MTLHIVGIEALTKLLDALTTKQSHSFITVQTDDLQSHLPSDKRGFIVDIYDREDYYIEAWDLNKERTYTLDEVKEMLEE
jgi:hypothetical protein